MLHPMVKSQIYLRDALWSGSPLLAQMQDSGLFNSIYVYFPPQISDISIYFHILKAWCAH